MKYCLSITLIAMLLCLVACGGSSSNRSYSDSEYSEDTEYSRSDEGEETSDAEESSDNEEAMITCPICNGTGVFEYMPGDAMAPRVQCPGCNGNGQVTQEQYNKIIETQRAANPTPRQNNSDGRYSNDDEAECPDCHGRGLCTSCAGKGWTEYEQIYTGGGTGVMECPICKGTGQCQTCHGRGHL